MKWCSRHKKGQCDNPNPQPYECFVNDKRASDGLSSECKHCHRKRNNLKNQTTEGKEYWKEFNQSPKRKLYSKDYSLKRLYGITLKQKQSMFDAQNGKCVTCNESFKNFESVCLDHDHKTGKIRGLLCRGCNNAIGLVKENCDTLDNMIRYLNDYKTI